MSLKLDAMPLAGANIHFYPPKQQQPQQPINNSNHNNQYKGDTMEGELARLLSDEFDYREHKRYSFYNKTILNKVGFRKYLL
jgi:hypothetical protein